MTTLRIDSVPVAQPRHRIMRTGIGFIPKEHPIHMWKAELRLAWRGLDPVPDPLTGSVALDVEFVLPRPKRLKTGERAMYARRPDLDNLIKSVKDALNGLAWTDDALVCRVRAVKWYASSDEAPHCELTITGTEGDGR